MILNLRVNIRTESCFNNKIKLKEIKIHLCGQGILPLQNYATKYLWVNKQAPYLLCVNSGQMHDPRFTRSTGLNEVPRSKHNSSHATKHNGSIWMLHWCFHYDACSFWQVSPPRPNTNWELLLSFNFKGLVKWPVLSPLKSLVNPSFVGIPTVLLQFTILFIIQFLLLLQHIPTIYLCNINLQLFKYCQYSCV
jgi:hypothetical protein